MPFPPTFTRLHALLAFMVVLLAITFFMGDTGVYSDDYFFNQRDPATGEIHGLIMNRPWHPWRPLARLVLTPLITSLWNHPWLLHAISAGLHALVIALVYGIMRRLRIPARIAAPAALALMAYPVYFEIVLWNAAICTLLSVVLMLLVWRVYLWWLAPTPERSGAARLAAILAMGLLAYASAALNEQPVGTLLALPLAPAALGLAAGQSRTRRVVRTVLPIVCVGLAIAIYAIGLFNRLHQIDGRITRDRTEGVAGLLHRAGEIVKHAPSEMLLHDFGSGAWSEGIDAIGLHPIRACLLAAILGVLGIVWLIGGGGRPDQTDENTPRPLQRFILIGVLGLAWMISAWLPVIASYMVTWPRLHYVPAIGLAIATAAFASMISPCLARLHGQLQAALISAIRVGFILTIGFSVILWIGLQSNFQRRAAADHAEIEPLARVFGPSIEPGTYFIPVHIDSQSAATGVRRFDDYFRHGWYWQFSAGWRLQSALRSSLAYTVQADTGVAVWCRDENPELAGLLRATLVRPRPADGLSPNKRPPSTERVLPWNRAVFFEIDGLGNTRIFTKLRLHPKGRGPIEIIPRQIVRSRAASELPEHILDIYPMDRRDAPIPPGERDPDQ